MGHEDVLSLIGAILCGAVDRVANRTRRLAPGAVGGNRFVLGDPPSEGKLVAKPDQVFRGGKLEDVEPIDLPIAS